jgi:hypothetical protein
MPFAIIDITLSGAPEDSIMILSGYVPVFTITVSPDLIESHAFWMVFHGLIEEPELLSSPVMET